MSDTVPEPKPKRCWYQYSLRTLLLFMVLCAFACSWFAVKMQQARRQREAVKAIEEASGIVVYDYELNRPPVGSPQPPGPAWMRKLLGVDFFAAAELAYLRSDASQEHLKDLPKLKTISLWETQVTDASLKNLIGLSNLGNVVFPPEQITDAGLVHLKGLTNLHRLDLSKSQITDAGLQHLKGWTNLEDLHIDRTQVTAAAAEELQRALPNCKIIHYH